MADDIYTDIKDRCVALQMEAVPGSDARNYFDFSGGMFPYWKNRLGPASYDYDSEDFQEESRQITMRLVIGHFTSDYMGQTEDVLGDYIEAVKQLFAKRPQLTSDTYPTGPTYTTAEGAYIQRDGGLQYFEIAPSIAVYEVGVEFTLTVPLYRETFSE